MFNYFDVASICRVSSPDAVCCKYGIVYLGLNYTARFYSMAI